jgi:hypothetical protein
MSESRQIIFSQEPAYFRLLGYFEALGRVFNSADYVCWFDVWLLGVAAGQSIDAPLALKTICPAAANNEARLQKVDQEEARRLIELLIKLPVGDPKHERFYPNEQVHNALFGLWERIHDCFHFSSAEHYSYDAQGGEELRDYALAGFTLVSITPGDCRALIIHGGASGRARSDNFPLVPPIAGAEKK